MLRPSVSGHYVREFVAFLDRKGVSPAFVRRSPGFDATQMGQPAARVAPSVVCRLFDYWSAELECPHLGRDFGLGIADSGLGLIGAVARTAPTMREGLNAALTLLPLLTTASSMHIDMGEREFSIVWRPGGRPLTPQFAEAALSAWISHAHAFGEERLPVQYVAFAHRRRNARSDYEDRYGCPVVFGADASRIVLAREALEVRSQRADPELHRRLAALGDPGWRTEGRSPQAPIMGLFDRVWADFRSGTPRVDSLARTQRMGRRTLQRRLSEESLTFRRAVDAVRAGAAIDELLQGELSVGQIAEAMHYSEHSAFTRAFRRWTGLSPMTFRKHLLSAAAR